MSNPAVWKKLCKRHGRKRPLVFVAGMRHAIGRGDYCGMHSHCEVEIVFHPKGRGVTRLGNRPCAFEEGSAVIYAPGEAHDQRMESDGEDFCVQLAVPASTRGKLKAGFYVPRVDRQWLVEDLQHLCRSRSAPGGFEQRIFNLRATAVLLALVDAACLSTANGSRSRGMRRVEQAEQFINEHFASIRSLNDIAVHVGVSHDYLRHAFKAARGKSLVRHLNEVKVARARLLLTNSPLPLKQIATMCGFRDEYYFSAVFRKLAALSPGAYRNRAASGGLQASA